MGFTSIFPFFQVSTKQQKGGQKNGSSKKQWNPDPATFMTEDEVLEMFRSAERRKLQSKTGMKEWILIVLGFNTGLRISEIASLQCQHVVISGALYPYIYVEKGKGDKSRRVPLNTPCLEAIVEYFQFKKKWGEKDTGNVPFIQSPTGGPQYTRWGLYKAFRRVLYAAEGIEKPERFHPHSMRHTFGTHLYRASGYNLRLVQELLGHSHSRVTEVYASIINQDRTEAMEDIYQKGGRR